MKLIEEDLLLKFDSTMYYVTQQKSKMRVRETVKYELRTAAEWKVMPLYRVIRGGLVNETSPG
jgi:hypothetical protein